ncbi:hypothetical protein LTR65_009998 [Meristemomyces frigidus]
MSADLEVATFARIRADIDLGSGVAKIAAQHVLPGTDPQTVIIDDIPITGFAVPEFEQKVVLDDLLQVLRDEKGNALIGAQAVLPPLTITITEAVVETAFQSWLPPEKKIVVEHLEGTKVKQLQQSRKIKYYQSNEKYPVAHGALQLYLENEPDQLPSEIYFYPSRSEEWTYEHKEATGYRFDEEDGKKHPEPLLDRTEPDKWDPSIRLVPHQLSLLFELLPSREQQANVIPIKLCLDADESNQLRFEIFSSRKKLPEHTALYTSTGKIRRGVEKWPMTFVDAWRDNELTERGYEVKETNGIRHVLATALVEMSKAADHLDVTVQLLEPGADLRYAEEQLTEDSQYEVILTATKELWDVNRSHKISMAMHQLWCPPKERDPCDFRIASQHVLEALIPGEGTSLGKNLLMHHHLTAWNPAGE